MSMYQIADNKFAVEWPIVTIKFSDGGQITCRDNGHVDTLIGDRKVSHREYSKVVKTGSQAECQKQV